MIEIKNLTITYGSTLVLSNVNVALEEGKIYGLLGPNGSGKTSLLKILLTICKPYNGEVLVNGEDLFKNKNKIKRQIGFVTDQFLLFDKLNAYEYLEFFGALYGMKIDDTFKKRSDYLLDLLNLKSKAGYLIETYSFGMKKKLSFISAIIHNPRIILLDEPLAGVDIESAYVIKSVLKYFAEKGAVILLATHILEVVQSLCDDVIILNKGEVAASGSVNDILFSPGNKDVEKIFLTLTGGSKFKDLADSLKKDEKMFPIF